MNRLPRIAELFLLFHVKAFLVFYSFYHFLRFLYFLDFLVFLEPEGFSVKESTGRIPQTFETSSRRYDSSFVRLHCIRVLAFKHRALEIKQHANHNWPHAEGALCQEHGCELRLGDFAGRTDTGAPR